MVRSSICCATAKPSSRKLGLASHTFNLVCTPSTTPICAISSSPCTACSTPAARVGARTDADAIIQTDRRIARLPGRRWNRGGVVSAPGLVHQPQDSRTGDDLRYRADAGDHGDVARPAFPDAV